MNISLQAHESAAKGLERIFLSHLQNARECLAHDGRLTDAEIHNARKSISALDRHCDCFVQVWG
jgi:hypothetical protein